MCQECCVMVGLAHSKFPFPYDTLLMLTFLQLSSSSWKEWGACAEMFGALLRKHSRWVTQNQAFVCCVLAEKGSRPQWYKYYTAGVKTLKMCFFLYKRNCYGFRCIIILTLVWLFWKQQSPKHFKGNCIFPSTRVWVWLWDIYIV